MISEHPPWNLGPGTGWTQGGAWVPPPADGPGGGGSLSSPGFAGGVGGGTCERAWDRNPGIRGIIVRFSEMPCLTSSTKFFYF